MIGEILKKRRFDLDSDRLGPDCPFTHWRLYFQKSMNEICHKKFRHFGEGAAFRAGAYAITCSKISLGKNVTIRPETFLFADPRDNDAGQIIIEDNVLIGSGVHIYVSNHTFNELRRPIMEQGHNDPKTVTVREGTWIGANVTILAGVTIGKNCVIGAGSIVTKNIEDFTIAVGNPAKFVKKVEDY